MSMMITSSPDLLKPITSSACPLQDHLRSPRRKTTSTWTSSTSHLAPRLIRVSCNTNDDAPQKPPPPSSLLMDRRDMLIALGGGLYGASSSSSSSTTGKLAMANPVMPPDLTKCHTSSSSVNKECCPPYTTSDIVDYKFPSTPLRVRRAAQNVRDDEEYMAKYKEAVQKMKALPDDHPWNYYQQAQIHCAYCNEAYDQVGFPGVTLQVHYSWLFLPWHRYYLHFYERILGKLIGDDTFTLPYWNFDSGEGMTFPEIFTDKSSSIYNENRDTNHYPPAILDYKYGYGNKGGSNLEGRELILSNLCTMQSTFKQSLQLAELFMGDPVRAGDGQNTASSGQLESIHNSVHQWVGPAASPHTDMGDFSTAARDSVFYSLHSNVDRLWHLYRTFRGNRVEFDDKDRLDATFVFYDEEQQVRDCLNPYKLSYTYEEVPIPWMGKLPCKTTSDTTKKTDKDVTLVPVGEFGSQPRELESVIRVLVPRPAEQRKKTEKTEKVEVLFVKDIVVTKNGPVRFDVYIAAPYGGDRVGPEFGAFAGSFVKLPHNMKKDAEKAKGGKKERKVYLKLGLTSLLEDLEIEDVEKLVVTLVPRVGDQVTVGSIAIKLLQTDSPAVL